MSNNRTLKGELVTLALIIAAMAMLADPNELATRDWISIAILIVALARFVYVVHSKID